MACGRLFPVRRARSPAGLRARNGPRFRPPGPASSLPFRQRKPRTLELFELLNLAQRHSFFFTVTKLSVHLSHCLAQEILQMRPSFTPLSTTLPPLVSSRESILEFPALALVTDVATTTPMMLNAMNSVRHDEPPSPPQRYFEAPAYLLALVAGGYDLVHSPPVFDTYLLGRRLGHVVVNNQRKPRGMSRAVFVFPEFYVRHVTDGLCFSCEFWLCAAAGMSKCFPTNTGRPVDFPPDRRSLGRLPAGRSRVVDLSRSGRRTEAAGWRRFAQKGSHVQFKHPHGRVASPSPIPIAISRSARFRTLVATPAVMQVAGQIKDLACPACS